MKKLTLSFLFLVSIVFAGDAIQFADGGFETGFERPWRLVTNGQEDAVKVETVAEGAFKGRRALKVTLTEKMRSYCCVVQGMSVQDDSLLPRKLSLTTRATSKAEALFRYQMPKNADGKITFLFDKCAINPSEDWNTTELELNPRRGTTIVQLEIRFTEPGSYYLDDVRLSAPLGELPQAALVIAPVWREGDPRSVDSAFATMMYPGRELWDELQKAGFTLEFAQMSSQLDAAFLSQFNLVIMGCEGESGQNPPSVERQEQLRDLLMDYVRRGGGLMAFRSPGWCFDGDLAVLNRIFGQTGGQVLPEQVIDRKRAFKTFSNATMYWTGNIGAHEVTRGVRGIFYPEIYSPGYATYTDFTSPVKCDAKWQVLVSGSTTASTFARGKGQPLRPEGKGSYQSEPPMLAVREFGKGRLALFPMTASIFWHDAEHVFWGRGATAHGEFEGYPGDSRRLVLNLFRWLSEPSKGVFGGYEPKIDRRLPPQDKVLGFEVFDWDKAKLEGDVMPHRYRGLIGAHSSLSDGKATPQELIAAAKKAGFDFLAFLEPLEQMTEEKFNELKRICEESSGDTFMAYPGFLYLDESGNSWGAFDNKMYWPKQEWRSTKFSGRFSNNNAPIRAWGWPCTIMLSPNRQPEPHYLQGNFNAVAVFTYQDGKLLDDARELMFKMHKDSFVFSPVAVHLVDTPDAVMNAAQHGFQTWVCWKRNNVVEAYNGTHCRCDGDFVNVRPCFTAEPGAPEIGDFRILNFGTSDLSLDGCERWRMHVRLYSGCGLKEVIIRTTDGRVFRRFLLNGEHEFDRQIDGFHSDNARFILTATDLSGAATQSSMVGTSVQENYFPRCSDNLNTMPRGKWYGQPEHMQNIRGFEDYLAQRILDYTGQPRWSGIGNIGEAPAVEYELLHCSRYATMLRTSSSLYYPNTTRLNSDSTDKPELAVPNPNFRWEVNYTYFTGRLNAPFIKLIEGDITILKDFDGKESLQIYGTRARRASRNLVFTKADNKLDHLIMGLNRTNFISPVPQNGLAGMYSDSFNGSFGFIPLSAGLLLDARATDNASFFSLYGRIDHPKHFTAGEHIKFRYMSVNSQFDPPEDDSFITDVHSSFGIGGQPCRYKVTPSVGKVLEAGYPLKLQAENGVVLAKSEKCILPLDLPVTVAGINLNWDAGILYRGKTRLLIPVWSINEYRQRFIRMEERERTDELQRIPVGNDGTAILQINTDLDDHDLFIGNLITADNKDIHLHLLDIRPGKRALEAHNPTDTPITCTVRPAPELNLLGDFSRQITVPAGASVFATW
ncbi:MAG: hypothetical protein IJS15_08985 [Victivallales bacterium]|nr:hypothetical protein [Victivallales bacterium]